MSQFILINDKLFSEISLFIFRHYGFINGTENEDGRFIFEYHAEISADECKPYVLYFSVFFKFCPHWLTKLC